MEKYRVCFLFRVDSETGAVIERMVDSVAKLHPDLVNRLVSDGTLPYHMTMIGGGSVPASWCDEAIRGITSVLKPFQSELSLPAIGDIEMTELNGNYLGIRLKFIPKSYILTGDRAHNKQLVKELDSGFDFDGVRHVSCMRISGGFKEMDTVKPVFSNLIETHTEELLRMRLLPEVWVRREKVWSRHSGAQDDV